MNSCEAHLTPWINQMRIRFACRKLGCTSKECGEFTAIFWRLTTCQWIFVDLLLWFICLQLARSNSWFNYDWVTFWKLVSNLYFTCSCWGAIPWIVVRLKSIIQEREFSEYLRNELDALKTRWFGNNAWPTVSMILARHLFTLVTVTRSWEGSHFGGDSWWCTNHKHLNVSRWRIL